MALSLRLRDAVEADAPLLEAIEAESFAEPNWRADDFLRYDCVVGEAQMAAGEWHVAGFLVSREIFPGTTNTPPEREILNIAVAARFRRCGLGARLLENELKRGAEVFLEVRETNTTALQLYRNAGFTEVARRENYYDNPVESAIVMRMKW